MNILAAILLIGATGHAERSMETDASIGRIVASVAWGAVSDVALSWEADFGAIANRVGGILASHTTPVVSLAIDGESRTGWRSWAAAGLRVGGYVADVRSDGSVGLAYSLQIRGYAISTTTAVSDGQVIKTVDAWWTETTPIIGRITRKVPIHVSITIRATEDAETTRLIGIATGTADTSDFRCQRIRRNRAEPDANAALRVQLPAVLRTIEREGRLFYAGGADIADVLDRIKLGIKLLPRR